MSTIRFATYVCFLLTLSIAEARPMLTWIARPWEYRYIAIFYEHSTYNNFLNKIVVPHTPGTVKERLLEREFTPTIPSLFLGKDAFEDQFTLFRFDFNQDGQPLAQSKGGDSLRAHINQIQSVVLAPEGKSEEDIYLIDLGEFFIGSRLASNAIYSPAICSDILGDGDPRSAADRYAPDFEVGYFGYFGCREWAAQLYDKERPYIDVTSYEGNKKFIRRFIGFSRFQDAPKPVIGNHKGRWACLIDCPNGDAPGIIPNIKVWASRNNWKIPQKPKNVREFMNTTEPDFEE